MDQTDQLQELVFSSCTDACLCLDDSSILDRPLLYKGAVLLQR